MAAAAAAAVVKVDVVGFVHIEALHIQDSCRKDLARVQVLGQVQLWVAGGELSL